MARGLRRSELVGRGAEMASLRRLVDDATEGRGAVVLLTGEAGVGKSRLLRETADCAASAGLVVLRGAAVEAGGSYRPVSEALLGRLRDSDVAESVELRPFRSALARIIPGWEGATGAVDAGTDPVVVLGEGVLRVLRQVGGTSGCALLLDDLHWADVDTIAVVEFLAGAVGTSPVLVVGAARSDEPAPDRLGRLRRRDDVIVIGLARLASEDVQRLAANSVDGATLPADVTRFLLEGSDGLPLVAEELLIGLVESGVLAATQDGWEVRGDPASAVPPTLAEIVAGRLARLAPAERRVVDAAAVIGRDVDWTLLQPATLLSEDLVLAGLRAGVGQHLLVADGSPGRLRWRHALTRDAVLAELAAPEHALFAGRVAEVLDQHAGDDLSLATDLFVRAGQPSRAAALLQRQARHDLSLGALGVADEHLERAARLDAALPGVAADRVRVLSLSGRAADAVAVGDAALSTVRGDDHAELCLRLARATASDGRWDSADAYLARAGRPDDPRTLAVAADVAFGRGETRLAADLARRTLGLAERAALPEEQCAALEVLGRCARESELDDAATAFARAAQVAAEHGLVPARISALVGLGTVELLPTDESPRLLEARELALDAGMLSRVCSIDLLLADGSTLVEGPAAGAARALEMAELASRLGLSSIAAMAELLSASGPAAVGDTSEAVTRLDRAAARRDAPVEVTALRPWIMALGPIVAGDLEQARDLLDEGVEQVSRRRATAPLPHWGLWALVRTVLADRDTVARDTLRVTPAVIRGANRGALMYADAVAAGRGGRPAEAAAGFAAADAVLATQHWWRRLLRLLACQAAITDRWGDPVAELRADLSVFEATGEDRLARACRDQLRRAGVTVRRGRGTAPVPPWLRALGVTSREMDVLTLVSDGLTNAQLAERLYLSTRTVETHVASLLTKTATTTRRDLAAFVARGPNTAAPTSTR